MFLRIHIKYVIPYIDNIDIYLYIGYRWLSIYMTGGDYELLRREFKINESAC